MAYQHNLPEVVGDSAKEDIDNAEPEFVNNTILTDDLVLVRRADVPDMAYVVYGAAMNSPVVVQTTISLDEIGGPINSPVVVQTTFPQNDIGDAGNSPFAQQLRASSTNIREDLEAHLRTRRRRARRRAARERLRHAQDRRDMAREGSAVENSLAEVFSAVTRNNVEYRASSALTSNSGVSAVEHSEDPRRIGPFGKADDHLRVGAFDWSTFGADLARSRAALQAASLAGLQSAERDGDILLVNRADVPGMATVVYGVVTDARPGLGEQGDDENGRPEKAPEEHGRLESESRARSRPPSSSTAFPSTCEDLGVERSAFVQELAQRRAAFLGSAGAGRERHQRDDNGEHASSQDRSGNGDGSGERTLPVHTIELLGVASTLSESIAVEEC